MSKIPTVSEVFPDPGIVPVKDIPATTFKVDPQVHFASMVEVDGENRCGLLLSFIRLSSICNQHDGLGLSDVQIGGKWKLFIVKAKPDDEVLTRYPDGSGYRCFVNCEYEPLTDDKTEVLEGCLSLPGRFFRVPRWDSVRVYGLEFICRKGQIELKPFEQVMSNKTYDEIVFQHEIDHHNNILISDIGEEVFLKPVPKGE